MSRTTKHRVRPENLGASIWLDENTSEIAGDRLGRLLHEHEITGVRFSLPMWERAISPNLSPGGNQAALGAYRDSLEVYSRLLAEAVRPIAEQLEPISKETEGRDGFVAVPLAAELSHDLEALVEEGERLWAALDRKNVIALVPATEEGICAMRRLIGAGVNAGVCHLFSVQRYREAWEAYLAGMEERTTRTDDVRQAASMAEFALGYLDQLSRTEPRLAAAGNTTPAADLAVATARVAYGWYLQSAGSDRFQMLARAGARAPRLAWSAEGRPDLLTSRRIPDEVIGPATVCELPARSIRGLRKRSLDGEGIRRGLHQAQEALDFYRGSCPELEQRFDEQVENLISEQVVRTDQAVASILRQNRDCADTGPTRR